MNIPVLLESTATGFRASTGAPLNLSAEAPTEEQPLAMIQREYVLKQIAGARIVELSVPDDKLVEAEYEANEAAKEASEAAAEASEY